MVVTGLKRRRFYWREPLVKKSMTDSGTNSALYGLGMLGAAVYFIQHATSFWEGALGLLKAVFWPGVVLYRVLELLKL